MVLLALDTASSFCAVAVAGADGTVLAARVEERRTGHAERLVPMIADILGEAGLAKDDLTKIAVSVGPGSFTGVRTAIAAARGLALALSIPAVGVTTLEAMTAEARAELGDVPILAVIDAGRGEVYAAAVDAEGRCVMDPCKMPSGRFAGDGADLPMKGMRFVGDGVEALGLTADALHESRTGAIETFAALGLRREPNGAPEPLYLRGADAKPPSATARIARKVEGSPG